jgi:hypothetical protein
VVLIIELVVDLFGQFLSDLLSEFSEELLSLVQNGRTLMFWNAYLRLMMSSVVRNRLGLEVLAWISYIVSDALHRNSTRRGFYGERQLAPTPRRWSGS